MGERIEANYRGHGVWYPGTIMAVHVTPSGGVSYAVDYEDGDHEERVSVSVGCCVAQTRGCARARARDPRAPGCGCAAGLVLHPTPRRMRRGTPSCKAHPRLFSGRSAVRFVLDPLLCARRFRAVRRLGKLGGLLKMQRRWMSTGRRRRTPRAAAQRQPQTSGCGKQGVCPGTRANVCRAARGIAAVAA